jgi:hypothetical protein
VAFEAGAAFVQVVPSFRGFHARVARELNVTLVPAAERAGDEAGVKGGRKFGARFRDAALSPLKGFGGAIAAAFAGAQVVKFFSDSVGAASDLNESLSKSQVVFGQSAGAVEKFADTAATALGQSKQQALEAAGTFGNLFVSMKIGAAPASEMSTKLIGLAGDLASFNNVDPAEALDALRSGLVGETEPLRRFGVNLSAAAIEAEALRTGLVKGAVDMTKVTSARAALAAAQERLNKVSKDSNATDVQRQQATAAVARAEDGLKKSMGGKVPVLTAAQKAQAAYSLIMDQTATAQGDFSRTSGGLANQQRILTAEFSDAKAQIGSALLPVALKLTTWLTGSFVPGLKDSIKWMGDNAGALKAIAVAVGIGLAAWAAYSVTVKTARAITAGIGTAKSIVSGVAGSWETLRLRAMYAGDAVKGAGSKITSAASASKNAAGSLLNLGKTAFITAGRFIGLAVAQARSAAASALAAGKTILLSAAQKIAAVTMAALNLVMSLNPLGLVVLAIAAVIAVVIVMYNKFKWFRDFINVVWTGIKAAFANGVKIVVNVFLGLVSAIIHGAANAFGWIPGIGGKLKTAAAAFDAFKDKVNRSLDGINDEGVNVSVRVPFAPGKDPGNKPFWQIVPKAEGGIENHVAQIARGGAMRLWAEPETGGEAYIPLAAGKRGRSTSILADVAGRFGYGLMPFANGGLSMTGHFPNVAKIASFTKAIAKAVAQAALDRAIAQGGLFGILGRAGALGQAALALARQFLGVPYLWGGTTASGFDCSGLVQFVYRHLGITNIPRTSEAQQAWAKNIPGAMAAVGDLLFFGRPAHHVGLFAGGNTMLDAPHTGANVRYDSLSGRSITSVGRVYDSGGWLHPGMNLAYNGTRRPEAVLTGDQWQAMVDGRSGGSAGDTYINVTPKYALMDERRLAEVQRVQAVKARVGRRR